MASSDEESIESLIDHLDEYTIRKVCQQLTTDQDYLALSNFLQVSSRVHRLCQPILKDALDHLIVELLDMLYFLAPMYQRGSGFDPEVTGSFNPHYLPLIQEALKQHQITTYNTEFESDQPTLIEEPLNRDNITYFDFKFNLSYLEGLSQRIVPFEQIVLFNLNKITTRRWSSFPPRPPRSYIKVTHPAKAVRLFRSLKGSPLTMEDILFAACEFLDLESSYLDGTFELIKFNFHTLTLSWEG